MIYIGIVSYNTLKDLPGCIQAIRRQNFKNIRIIVFDNNSTDRSVAWLRQQKNLQLITHHRNIGFGAGHNAIIRSCHLGKNDYYLALNPDVRLQPNYVRELVAICRKHEAGWGIGKLYKNIRTRRVYSVGHGLLRDGYALNIGYDLTDRPEWNVAREIFGAPGAAPLYSARLIRALSVKKSFFDPKMFLYYEDVDIDWRARLAGFSCWYAPKAIAAHPGGGFRKAFVIEALANRYRSVLKNAMLFDLVSYNLPIISLHIMFRFLVSPKEGWELTTKIGRSFFQSLTKRSRRTISRNEMNEWFRWSQQQLTDQPLTLLERVRLFWQRTYNPSSLS